MASRDQVSIEQLQERFTKSARVEERYHALQDLLKRAAEADRCVWLQHGLNDADTSVQALAIQECGRGAIYESLVPRLRSLLNSEDPDVRFEAARALLRWHQRGDEIATVLLNFLAEKETQFLMVVAVLDQLAHFPERAGELISKLKPLLIHERPEVRESAVRLVGSWGVNGLPLANDVAALLDDEEPFVREFAAIALGPLGSREETILAALQSATTDEDEVVALAAKNALAQLRNL